MPYIEQKQRGKLDPHVDELLKLIESAGDLNYLFTKLLLGYTQQRKVRYVTINTAIGAIEAAKLEYYRRMAAPYENIKIKENGDVY